MRRTACAQQRLDNMLCWNSPLSRTISRDKTAHSECWNSPLSRTVSLVTLRGHPSTVHGENRTQGRNTVRHPRVRRWHATWPRHRCGEVLEVLLHCAGLQSARWEVGGVGLRRHPLEVDAHLQSREQEVEGIDHAYSWQWWVGAGILPLPRSALQRVAQLVLLPSPALPAHTYLHAGGGVLLLSTCPVPPGRACAPRAK